MYGRPPKRQKLIQHGIRYADRELESVDGLKVLDKWQIQTRVKEGLSELHGDETAAQVEEIVEDVLEAEGIGWDNDEEDEYEDD